MDISDQHVAELECVKGGKHNLRLCDTDGIVPILNHIQATAGQLVLDCTYTSEVIPYRIISVNLLPDNVWSLAVEMVLNETSTCESIPPLDPVQVSWALLVWDANYQFSL